MNRNRKKKNRKKETGAVVSLLLASSLAFGGCGTAVTSASFVNTESASTESTGETSADQRGYHIREHRFGKCNGKCFRY